jgi:hypothetical protein
MNLGGAHGAGGWFAAASGTDTSKLRMLKSGQARSKQNPNSAKSGQARAKNFQENGLVFRYYGADATRAQNRTPGPGASRGARRAGQSRQDFRRPAFAGAWSRSG